MSMRAFKAQIAAALRVHRERVELTTESVSFDGIVLRTDMELEPMSLQRVSFALPSEGGSLELHCVVTRVVAPTPSGAPARVEMSFFAKSGDASTRWNDFVQALSDAAMIERTVIAASKPPENRWSVPPIGGWTRSSRPV